MCYESEGAEMSENPQTTPEEEFQKFLAASDTLGRWMSAALDDPKVCKEMKEDIDKWFEAMGKFQ